MARCSKGTLLLYNPKAPRDERYVFIEDTCRRITCPDCVHKAAKRLEGNIAVYARQDRLHYFITITTSLEETEAAIIELQAMWTGIRRDMGNLHYETYRRYRQSRDKAKFNENTGSARWKSIIGNYIQDDISYSCDNLMRSQFNFAFASQHGVYLKKLPESAQRAFLNEHRSELDELFPMYKQNVGLTDADKQRVIDRVQAMYRNVLAQSIGPIKFVRVIERGENGHLHFHILCNYPLPHGIHLKHSTVTSQIYNVQYAALNQNSEDPNLAAISAYISKMAHYASKFIHFIHDIGDHVIVTGSNGYELLTDEPRDKSLQYVDFINGLEIPDGSMAVSYKQMRAMSKGNIG